MQRRIPKRKRLQIEKEIDQFAKNHLILKKINPMTKNQEKLFDAYKRGKNILSIGSAGTGKTFISLYLALRDVVTNGNYKEIIILRSAVQSREQGFMPGSLKEKQAYFETPYIDIVNNLFERGDAYSILKQRNMINFMTTSFIRGLTFDDALIIVDEVQSCNYHELDTVITRVGNNSRILFCGDVKQDDLKVSSRNRNDISGLKDFIRVINRIESFETIEFRTEDIVRSGLVKEYILAKEIELEAA